VSRYRILALAAALTIGVAGLLSMTGCAGTVPNRNPETERFPSVSGRALTGDVRRIPEDFAGRPTVVIVGYVQNAQFDIDRWLLGLVQAETPVEIVEAPTIDGLVPGMFAGTIDAGMRSGIPREDWPAVVTLYGDDAARAVAGFGNENPRNGRVALLDADGVIRWFHDRGYSASHLLELDREARDL
jgi:hypothetical protein